VHVDLARLLDHLGSLAGLQELVELLAHFLFVLFFSFLAMLSALDFIFSMACFAPPVMSMPDLSRSAISSWTLLASSPVRVLPSTFTVVSLLPSVVDMDTLLTLLWKVVTVPFMSTP